MTAIPEPEKERTGKVYRSAQPLSVLPKEILTLWSTVIHLAAEPQFLIDQDHQVVSWNRPLEICTGVKEADVLGTAGHWKAFYQVKQPCLADSLMDDICDDKAPGHVCITGLTDGHKAYETTAFFPHMGCRGKWLHVIAVPVYDEDRRVAGIVETLEDLSIKKQLECALELSEKRLDLMNEITWHEIENKITGMRGYVELSRQMVNNEKAALFFEAEERILGQIHELIRCSIDYQRIGNGLSRWVNVKEVISSVISIQEIDTRYVDLDVEGLEIYGDPSLEMMFSYLVKNTHTSQKTSPKIRIGYAEISQGLSLIYEDNSPTNLLNQNKDTFREKIIKADTFYKKFVHDSLEISGMAIRETSTTGTGRRFEMQIPRGAYRFTNIKG